MREVLINVAVASRFEAEATRSMKNLYPTILLFGPPGSGKGTLGKMVASIPGFFHSACGDVFRRLNPNTELGRTFLDYSSRGELVPDDLTVKVWTTNINAHAVLGAFKPESDLLVLDGIPRTVDQAKVLRDTIDVEAILHLICTDEARMIERLRRRALKENRIDDAKESVIRNRWKVYNDETAPVLDFYPPAIVNQVDSMKTPAEVLRLALDVIIPIQEAHYKSHRPKT